MPTKIEIWNMAIGNLGSGKTVASLTERSAERYALDRFWDIALDMTLRSYPWRFARRRVALALVESNPNSEWGYSFRYPSDAVFLIRIESGTRTDNRQSRVEYEEEEDDAGRLILCDLAEPVMVYTKLTDNTNVYPSDFVMALSQMLSSLIAPSITAGDPFGKQKSCLQLFNMYINEAKANNMNEIQPAEDPEAEMIRARE